MVETSAPTAVPVAATPAKGTKPFAAFEWMIARRYMGTRRKETFISVISAFSFTGIMLGVATLIIVMAVMNGFRTELLGRILGINGHIIVQPVERPLNDFNDVAARIEGVDGVTHAVSLVEGQVLASGGRGGTGALVRGMTSKDIAKVTSVVDNLLSGSLDEFKEGSGVLVGSRLAENLGLGAGDRITLISPEGNITPLGVTPRVKSYPIAAIFEIGMSQYDEAFVFMPMEEAQLYFNSEGVASVIEVFLEDADSVDALKGTIETAADRPHYLVDWRQRHTGFFNALRIERNVMFLILTLIVLVAALNIVSGLFMLVKDKGKDIAILRTMGATRGTVMRVFFITGSAIGVSGTIAGVILGMIVYLNLQSIQSFLSGATGTNLWDPTVRFLSEIPAEMDVSETVTVVAMAIGLSFLATLFPSWRAANLDPVEALRYE
ncbi:MAG: lipoprotein-releasing ABC transporter permease subunit [Pseudomonadota bacterium]